MADEPAVRKSITQPADWWDAWQAEADKVEVDLTVWIGDQCNKSLPKEVKKNLSQRKSRGRPRKLDGEDALE